MTDSPVSARDGVVSLHDSPDPASEVATQARLGDTATVEREEGGWLRLTLVHDGYSGWAPAAGFAPGGWPPAGGADPGAGPVIARVRALFAHLYAGPDIRSRLLLIAPLGAPLVLGGPAVPGESRWRKVRAPGGVECLVQEGDLDLAGKEWSWSAPDELKAGLVATAKRLLGIPYRWGGTTPWGLDCSGLVQLVYRLHGIDLPRDADQQAADPRLAPAGREELLPGDLLFFAKLGHVGMAVSHDEFIHATTSGRPEVQLTAVDDPSWAGKRDFIRRLDPAPPSGGAR